MKPLKNPSSPIHEEFIIDEGFVIVDANQTVEHIDAIPFNDLVEEDEDPELINHEEDFNLERETERLDLNNSTEISQPFSQSYPGESQNSMFISPTPYTYSHQIEGHNHGKNIRASNLFMPHSAPRFHNPRNPESSPSDNSPDLPHSLDTSFEMEGFLGQNNTHGQHKIINLTETVT